MALMEEQQVAQASIQEFRQEVRGEVVVSGDPSYESARRVWNAMADRRPAAIVRCSVVADIARALAFAQEHNLIIAVRGGGHSVPGFSTCDGGIVIDLSPMKGVLVTPIGKSLGPKAALPGVSLIGKLSNSVSPQPAGYLARRGSQG